MRLPSRQLAEPCGGLAHTEPYAGRLLGLRRLHRRGWSQEWAQAGKGSLRGICDHAGPSKRELECGHLPSGI